LVVRCNHHWLKSFNCVLAPLCHRSDQDTWVPGDCLFDCLAPAVMPSLHTVELSDFDIRATACVDRLIAALREGALVHVKVGAEVVTW
jgi:hypothetical protein